MAGNAGNWFKVSSGELKGRSVYLSKAQQESILGSGTTRAGRRLFIAKYLNGKSASPARNRDARAMADTERPAAAPRPAPKAPPPAPPPRPALSDAAADAVFVALPRAAEGVTPAPTARYTRGGSVPGSIAPAQTTVAELIADYPALTRALRRIPAGERVARGDPTLALLMARQGFGGKPTLVSKQDMDALVADGHEELFRGVAGAPGRVEQYVADHLDGPFYAGSGIYGQGMYTATAGATGADRAVAQQVAAAFATFARSGATMRMALRKDAKVADYGTVEVERVRWHRAELQRIYDAQQAGALTKAEAASQRIAVSDIASDAGFWATAMGYDAMRVPRGRDSGGMGPDGGRGLDPGQVVVYNRTAVIMEATIYDAQGIRNT